MDKDMQIDSDEDSNSNSSGFIFSRPNIVYSPEKMVNIGAQSDNIFGVRSVNLPETSAYTFAEPAAIEKLDCSVKTKKSGITSKSSKNRKSLSLSIEELKKSDPFLQLEKNSKKTKDAKLELSNSISCTDLPEFLLEKKLAREYFELFGEILKITVRPKRNMVTVYYASKEDATRAYNRANSFLGHRFKTHWTTSEMLSASKQKKKESVKNKISSILNIDDEVKEELEAMSGLEYNIPDPQHLKALTVAAKAKIKKAKVVANKESPKRITPLLKTPVTKPVKPIIKATKSLVPEKVAFKALDTHQNITISSATIEELQNQVRQAGSTSEEKYKILDARDRLMRLKQGKQKDLATAKVTQGTCPDMCPEKERYMREFQRQLASFEQLDGQDYKINHKLATKQYSRSSADQEEPLAHDLRPVKSLKMTMSYLLYEIVDLCESDEPNLAEWYHFLWDRTRSIRKDITQQELCCVETVELVEQCARFHILSSERLCAEEASVFDPKINSENLTKCLQTLKYMYYDLREHGIQCKNEPEFRAYVILLNLNNGTFISELSTLSPVVQHSPEVKFALAVYSALTMDNYSKFFKLVRQTSYLNGCILLRYFNQVRVKALSIMVKAYCRTSGTTEYPLYELIDILGFEDEDEVFEFCSKLGLKVDKESLYIKLNKENFQPPSGNLEQGRAFNLVLSKRESTGQSIGQCIAGGTMPEKAYETHKPHCSFDSLGYLLPSSINAHDQNLVDPYEFIEENAELMNQKKDFKTKINKIQNNIEEQTVQPTERVTNTEFSFKPKSELTVSAPITNNLFAPTNTNKNPTPESKLFTLPINATVTSIFTKPNTNIFSSVQAKPPPSTNSPFGSSANKNIFSSDTSQLNQKNFFKPPSAPVAEAKPQANFKMPSVNTSASSTTTSKNTNITSTSATSSFNTERMSTKRRMDDTDGVVDKKSFLESEELRKKQQEAEEKLKSEREKLQRIEKIVELSHEQYKLLEKSVVEETCSAIVQAELNCIKLTKQSERVFDDIFQEICATILDEQLFIQDMLIEVDRRLRDRLVNKYYRLWKLWAAKRRAQRREALDNTPVWLQSESLEECARKLYHPEQKIAIRYARDQRKSLVEEEKKPKQTPIEFIVHVGLKENAKSLDVDSSQHTFWKMVISWPLLENRLTLWRHKTLVNKYLSPDDYTLEPVFIQHKPSPHESLSICIRYFEGLICENRLTGTDGLLFIAAADEDGKSIERRLTKSILSREKLMPVPLVILVFGDTDRDPENVKVSDIVEQLIEAGYVSEYSLLKERRVDETVVLKVIQSAILWLAINRSPAVPLEMDYLKRVFDDCLTEELWLRIQGHLAPKPQFVRALNDPNFIINLHNEAVNHIMDIMLDPESLSYTDFAPELKIYLPNKRSYPCTYEFFDSVWKHPEYRAELERIMSSFILPPWKETWPITDLTKLHDEIAHYCGQMLTYQSSLAITNNIMSDLFLISDHSEDSFPCFTDVIIHLINKKIGDIGGNTRVVYNKNHVKHFQMLPWWFKSTILQNYLVQHQEEMQEEESSFLERKQVFNTSESQLDIDIDCDVDKLSETFWQQEEESFPVKELCQEARSHVLDVLSTAKKLEKQLEEQRLKNKNLEVKLKEALQDGC